MHKVKHPMFWFCTNGKLPCVSCAEIKVDTGHVNTDIALKTWGWFLSQEYYHAGIVELAPPFGHPIAVYQMGVLINGTPQASATGKSNFLRGTAEVSAVYLCLRLYIYIMI